MCCDRKQVYCLRQIGSLSGMLRLGPVRWIKESLTSGKSPSGSNLPGVHQKTLNILEAKIRKTGVEKLNMINIIKLYREAIGKLLFTAGYLERAIAA